MTEAKILDDIVRREGGFVDHPADAGGPTNMGITLATLSAFLKRPATVDELKALDKTVAKRIYKAMYCDPFTFVYSPKLRALVVDAAVNHGVNRATKWLQESIGVTADGVVGPVTEKAMVLADASIVYKAFLRRRIVFYGALITKNPSQAVFAEGWMRRVAEFI